MKTRMEMLLFIDVNTGRVFQGHLDKFLRSVDLEWEAFIFVSLFTENFVHIDL